MEVLTRGQAQTHRLYASVIARRRGMLGLEIPDGAEYPLHENIFNDHPEGHIKCITYSKHAENKEHFFDPQTLIPTEGECILDNFLIEQKRRFESGDEAAPFTTDKQLLFLLCDMFGAGLDTTSVTLSWFLLYMALYPEEQVYSFDANIFVIQVSKSCPARRSNIKSYSRKLYEKRLCLCILKKKWWTAQCCRA